MDQANGEYRLAIGDLRVDLRDIDFPEGETVVEASVMIGQLTVNVPPGTALSSKERSRRAS